MNYWKFLCTDFSLVLYLYIQPFILVHTHENLFYSLDANLILLYFVTQLVPAFAIESFSVGPFVPLNEISHHYVLSICFALFFNTAFLVLENALHFLSYPSPRISCLCKKHRFILLDNSIRNKDMGLTYISCIFNLTIHYKYFLHVNNHDHFYNCIKHCVYHCGDKL